MQQDKLPCILLIVLGKEAYLMIVTLVGGLLVFSLAALAVYAKIG